MRIKGADMFGYWFNENVIGFPRKAVNFFKNIIIFRKFLWENYWWDHHFIFLMLKIKLEYDAKMHRQHGNCVNSDNYAIQMESCVRILDRLVDDKFCKNFDEHEKKWGSSSFSIDDKGKFTIKKSPKAEQDPEAERKEFRAATVADDLDKINTVEELFSIMSKNILSWWD